MQRLILPVRGGRLLTGLLLLALLDLKPILELDETGFEQAQASTWPFDLDRLTTFAFYLIIPPLTWLGAAPIENLVDALIQG